MATVPTVTVLIRTAQITGTGLAGARVLFNFVRADIVAGSDGAIVPAGQSIVTCDEIGEGEGEFFPNELGTNSTQYGIQIYDAEGAQVFPQKAGAFALTSIPNTDPVLLHSVLYNVPLMTKEESDAYLEAALLAAARAEAAEDAARMSADQAADSAGSAASSAILAEGHADHSQQEADRATQQADIATAQVPLVIAEGDTQVDRVADEATTRIGQMDIKVDQTADNAALALQHATDANTSKEEAEAIVGDLGSLDAAVAASQTAATQAQAAAAAAAASASSVGAAMREYGTLAAALADVGLTNGMRFVVRNQTAALANYGSYYMERTATGHKWIINQLTGPYAALWNARRAQEALLLTPLPAGVTHELWGSYSLEWDGRVIVNRLGAVPPTLNAAPLPFNFLDEVGTTPAREPNTTAVLDPLGGNNALKLTHTAQAQFATTYRSSYGATSYTTDLRSRIKTQNISGGNQYRQGLASVSTGQLVTAPAGAWDATPWETTLAAYAGAADTGFGSATGNTTGVVAVFNYQLYDPLAGESASLPTDAQELAAAKSGHMKRGLSLPNSFVIDPLTGIITFDGAQGSAILSLDVNGVTLENGYTFGCMMEPTQEMPGTTGEMVMGFDRHTAMTNGASGVTHGQIGLYQNASSAYRIGKPFVNPTISGLAGAPTVTRYMLNQGMLFYAHSVTPNGNGTTATQRVFIDEVPHIMTAGLAWNTSTPPKATRIQVGAWNNTDEQHKVANPFVGRFGGFFFVPRPLSQDEIHQIGLRMCQKLRMDGAREAERRAWFMFNGDSLTAFSPSWAWHLSDHRGLSPRLFAHVVALGGTDIGGAWTDARRLRDLDLIKAAARAGFAAVAPVCRWLTNEVIGSDPWSWINNGRTHIPWRDDWVKPLMDQYRDAGATYIFGVTGPPRLGLGATNDDELANDLMVQAANDDMRNNPELFGWDETIDIGLATERMTSWGVFAPEAKPGGDFMFDWRCANASRSGGTRDAIPHAVTGTLHLSAANGNGVAAEASDAGTFLWHDRYRRITHTGSGTAYGRIMSIIDDRHAVIDFNDVTPTAWPGEPALVTTRDKIVRGGGFTTVDLAAGTWAIVSCQEEWQTDGIHQAEHGGRRESDRAQPRLQAFQASMRPYRLL